MKLTPEQINKLNEKLPAWAIKNHPSKSNMTVIHPMAVIDRLNEVFGIGAWNTKVEYLKSYDWEQKTKAGGRKVFTSTSKVILDIPEYNIHLEQFGGSTNDDEGDAMKGSATDALTKIASYLGIGASIYKGQGNTVTVPPVLNEEDIIITIEKLENVLDLDTLKETFVAIPAEIRGLQRVIEAKDKKKLELSK